MANMSLKKNEMPQQSPDIRRTNFDEVALGYTAEQAIDEAKRCLQCKNRPCVGGCPVNVKIPEFIAHVAEGDLLKQIHFLPSAEEFVRRRHSASQSVSAASKASRLQSADLSALLQTTICSTIRKNP